MTVDKNNIDKIFKDSFSGMEEAPPLFIWEDLKTSLAAHARQKRKAVLWYAAASIAMIFAFGAGFLVSLNQTQHKLVVNETKVINDNIENAVSNSIIPEQIEAEKKENLDEKENTFKHESRSIIPIKTLNSNKSNASSKTVAPYEKNQSLPIEFRKYKLKNIETDLNAEDLRIIAFSPIFDIPIELFVDAGNSDSKGKWMLGGNVSPLYSYRNVEGSNSLFNETYAEMNVYRSSETIPANTEVPMIAYAGGLNISYSAFDKLSISSGLGYSKIGQLSDYVYLRENNSTGTSNLSIINSSAGQIKSNQKSEEFMTALANNEADVVGIGQQGDFLYQNSANLVQNFEYVEIPLILKYRVIDKTVGVNLIAGMHTGFLVGNNAYVQVNEFKQKIGQTEDVRSISYNSTLGFGVDYELTERVQFQVEPIFKYSLQAIDRLNNLAHPYSFGVYTGCNYKF